MNQYISGVSPDAPIVENEKGGKQSKSEYAFHMIPPDALLDVAQVFAYGAGRYARDNWKKIPAEEHMNHALVHWFAWMMGDNSDNHAGHFLTRCFMAYQTAREGYWSDHAPVQERAREVKP